MMQFLYIKWNVDPEIFRIGGLCTVALFSLFALTLL